MKKHDIKQCLNLILKMFIRLCTAFATRSLKGSLASNSRGHRKCVSPNNWPCQARPTLGDINSNETIFYPLLAKVNKCGRS